MAETQEKTYLVYPTAPHRLCNSQPLQDDRVLHSCDECGARPTCAVWRLRRRPVKSATTQHLTPGPADAYRLEEVSLRKPQQDTRPVHLRKASVWSVVEVVDAR